MDNAELRDELLAHMGQMETKIGTMETNIPTSLLGRIEQGEGSPLARIERGKARLEGRLLLRIDETETKLLKEFRKWSIPVTSKVRTSEITLVGSNERISLLEERVDALEQGSA